VRVAVQRAAEEIDPPPGSRSQKIGTAVLQPECGWLYIRRRFEGPNKNPS
jgi:hypothetical protein